MAIQTDNYGRVVDISTQDLIQGMTAAVSKMSSGSGAAQGLAGLAKQTEQDKTNLLRQMKPVIDQLVDKLDIEEIEKYISDMRDLLQEMEKNRNKPAKAQKASKSATADFRNIVLGFEQALAKKKDNTIWDSRRAKSVDKFLYEATTGHSLHVHDYTVEALLLSIAKDIKHIGMLLASNIPNTLSERQRRIVGSFDERLPTLDRILQRGLGRGFAGRLLSKLRERPGYPTPTTEERRSLQDRVLGREPREARRERRRRRGEPPDYERLDPDLIVSPDRERTRDIGSAGRDHESTDRLREATERETESRIDEGKARERERDRLDGAAKALGYALRNNARRLQAQRHQMEILGQDLMGLPEMTAPMMEKLGKGIQNFSSLNKRQQQKLVDAMMDLRLSLEKTGGKGDDNTKILLEKAADLSAKYVAKEERRIRRESLEFMFENLLSKFKKNFGGLFEMMTPSHYNIGYRYDALERMKQIGDETDQYIRNFHLALSQSEGSTGTMMAKPGTKQVPYGFKTNNYDDLRAMFWEENELSKNFSITGQKTEKIQKVLLKNLQRGIRYQQQWVALSRQGLQLGTMIGVDSEQTSEELADWSQHMHFTVTQTGQFVSELQQVSRITGVTGDKLLEAAKAGRQLADSMRSAGTLSTEAARNLTQFAAAASRRGTEKITGPLMEALTGSVNLFDRASPQTFALAMHAAQRGGGAGLMASLQQGNIPNDSKSGKAFAKGLRDVFYSLTGGRELKQLSPGELTALNLASHSTYGAQLNDIKMMADTLEETFADHTDRIKKISEQIAKPETTTDERIALRAQKDRLERSKVGEDMNLAMRRLTEMTRPEVGMQATAEQELKNAIEGIRKAAEGLSGPGADAKRTEMNTQADALQARMNEALKNPGAFKDLVDQLRGVIHGGMIFEKMYQQDQLTVQRNLQEAHERAVFENMVRESLFYIRTWSPPYASIANTYKGIVVGFMNLAQRLGLIYLAITAFRALVAAMAFGKNLATGQVISGAAAGQIGRYGLGLGALGMMGYTGYQGYKDWDRYNLGWQGAAMGALTGTTDQKSGPFGYSFDQGGLADYGATAAYGAVAGGAIGTMIAPGIGTLIGGAAGAIISTGVKLADSFDGLSEKVKTQIALDDKLLAARQQEYADYLERKPEIEAAITKYGPEKAEMELSKYKTQLEEAKHEYELHKDEKGAKHIAILETIAKDMEGLVRGANAKLYAGLTPNLDRLQGQDRDEALSLISRLGKIASTNKGADIERELKNVGASPEMIAKAKNFSELDWQGKQDVLNYLGMLNANAAMMKDRDVQAKGTVDEQIARASKELAAPVNPSEVSDEDLNDLYELHNEYINKTPKTLRTAASRFGHLRGGLESMGMDHTMATHVATSMMERLGQEAAAEKLSPEAIEQASAVLRRYYPSMAGTQSFREMIESSTTPKPGEIENTRQKLMRLGINPDQLLKNKAARDAIAASQSNVEEMQRNAIMSAGKEASDYLMKVTGAQTKEQLANMDIDRVVNLAAMAKATPEGQKALEALSPASQKEVSGILGPTTAFLKRRNETLQNIYKSQTPQEEIYRQQLMEAQLKKQQATPANADANMEQLARQMEQQGQAAEMQQMGGVAGKAAEWLFGKIPLMPVEIPGMPALPPGTPPGMPPLPPGTPPAATPAKAPLDTYQNQYRQDLASVQVTGPIAEASGHLDEIKRNTKEMADNTARVKELLGQLVTLMQNPGTKPAPGATAANTKAASPANYYSASLDMTSNPNMGARRPV